MNKFFCTALLIVTFIAGCRKIVATEDILSNFVILPTEIPADGQSRINVSVVVSNESSSDRRNVVFSTTAGTFVASGTNKYTAKPEYDSGRLIAKAVLKSPIEPGTIKISVEPEFDSPIKEFRFTDSIQAKPSIPVSIKLEPTSFGIASNFLNDVQIIGYLKNKNGKFVSRGYDVLFEDVLLSGLSADGRFRDLKTVTADSSKVGGYYSANSFPIGTTIKIRCTVLNTGAAIPPADSILLTINQ